MTFLELQILLLRKVTEDGTISKDSPLLEEQKERIIDYVCFLKEKEGVEVDRTRIGAEIDKRFADELDVDC